MVEKENPNLSIDADEEVKESYVMRDEFETLEKMVMTAVGEVDRKLEQFG